MTWTLAILIDEGYRAFVCCEAGATCFHTAPLDLPALAVRLGPSHSALHDDLAPRFRCSRCGSRRVGFRLSPPGGADMAAVRLTGTDASLRPASTPPSRRARRRR